MEICLEYIYKDIIINCKNRIISLNTLYLTLRYFIFTPFRLETLYRLLHVLLFLDFKELTHWVSGALV